MSWLVAAFIGAAGIINKEEMEAELTARLEQATTLEDYKGIYHDSPYESSFRRQALDGWIGKFRERLNEANSFREVKLLIKDTPPSSECCEEIETKRDKLYFMENVQSIKNIDMARIVYNHAYDCSLVMCVITHNICTFLEKIEQMTNPEEIKSLLKTVSEDIRSIVEPIALDRIEQLKSNPV